MEYLVVHFPSSRRVVIDGKPNGLTETLIELEAGTHTVSLNPPFGFKPQQREILLKDTSPLSPCEVEFEPVE